MDGELLGTVDRVSDGEISIAGTPILAAAVSWDAAGEGELVERMERGELPRAPELRDPGRRNG